MRGYAPCTASPRAPSPRSQPPPARNPRVMTPRSCSPRAASRSQPAEAYDPEVEKLRLEEQTYWQHTGARIPVCSVGCEPPQPTACSHVLKMIDVIACLCRHRALFRRRRGRGGSLCTSAVYGRAHLQTICRHVPYWSSRHAPFQTGARTVCPTPRPGSRSRRGQSRYVRCLGCLLRTWCSFTRHGLKPGCSSCGTNQRPPATLIAPGAHHVSPTLGSAGGATAGTAQRTTTASQSPSPHQCAPLPPPCRTTGSLCCTCRGRSRPSETQTRRTVTAPPASHAISPHADQPRPATSHRRRASQRRAARRSLPISRSRCQYGATSRYGAARGPTVSRRTSRRRARRRACFPNRPKHAWSSSPLAARRGSRTQRCSHSAQPPHSRCRRAGCVWARRGRSYRLSARAAR